MRVVRLQPGRIRSRSHARRRKNYRPVVEVLEPRLALATAVGLTTSNTLVTFDTATPGTVSGLANFIPGLVAGDTLVAIDFRPATGQLYGLGVNGMTAHLYLIDYPNNSNTVARQVGGDIPLPRSSGAAGAPTEFGFTSTPSWTGFEWSPTTGTTSA